MVRKHGLWAILPGLSLAGSAVPLAQQSGRAVIPWWTRVLIALVLLTFVAWVIWWWLHRKEEPEVTVPHRVGEAKAAAASIPAAVVRDAPAAAAELPKVALPEDKVPDVALPEAVWPEAELPKVELPEARVPDVALPEAVWPEVELPKVELPEVKVPDLALLEVKAPAIPLVPDDLKLIEGIGPRIAGILNAAGVMTFGQLAALDPDRIRKMLESADPRLIRLADPTTWPEQARLAAAGEWDAFRALTEKLVAGRRS
jgi:predicted flap endonuclease-1-like 5' DNA nuclease